MALIMQSKPQLKLNPNSNNNSNNNNNNNKGSRSRLSKYLWYSLSSIAIVFLFGNLQMVSHLRSSNSHHGNKLLGKQERHPLPSTFPKLPAAKPRPSADQVSNTNTNDMNMDMNMDSIRLWEQWADPPLYGSYQYSSTSSIHFPYMELQSHFHKVKPQFQPTRFRARNTNTNTNTNTNARAANNDHDHDYIYPPAQALSQIPLVDSDFMLLTRKGNKFMHSGVKANQDRAVIVSPFHQEGNWLLALFDGHGFLGHGVAHLASTELPRQLLKRITTTTSPKEIPDIMRQTFLELHQIAMVRNSNASVLKEAGSTAVAMLKLGDTLYISNLGDSLAFVVKYEYEQHDDDETPYSNANANSKPKSKPTVEIVYQTKPHKPDDPLERARIERAGGTVLDAPFPGASSRLLIPLPNGDEVALAMSRSLGDAQGDSVGHSAEPTTSVLPLRNLILTTNSNNSNNSNSKNNKHIQFLCICASDGLLDKVSPWQVAQHVVTSFLPTTPLLPLEAAEQLLLLASKAWLEDFMGGDYRDDMTIAVHKLEMP
jgi:serine/threonine protein phosphatase PrpC